jgi:hypothetical protein
MAPPIYFKVSIILQYLDLTNTLSGGKVMFKIRIVSAVALLALCVPIVGLATTIRVPDDQPTLEPIGSKSAIEGDTLSFQVTASDPNGTTPELWCENRPAGASFNDNGDGTGDFYWPIAAGQIGVFSMLFIASDGNLSDSESVQISVASRPPSVDSLYIGGSSSHQNIISHSPLIGWRYSDFGEDNDQEQYELAVGSDTEWPDAELWDRGVIQTSDTFTIYAGSTLLDGQTYYLRLRVYNGLDWSNWFETSFRMNSPPSAPSLLQPTGWEVTDGSVTLWLENAIDPENDSLWYEIDGYHDTDCVVGPQIDTTDISEGPDSTGIYFDLTPAENCFYCWSARAFDGNEHSDWTGYECFSVDGIPKTPTAPQCIYPVGLPDDILYEMLPEFLWSRALDPDPSDIVRHRLEISLDSSFTFVMRVDSLIGNRHTLVDSLDFGRHYWWKVLANDLMWHTSMSDTSDFWTWTLGDFDHTHLTDIGDLTILIDALLISLDPIEPPQLGDVTGDCIVDIGDVSRLIAHLFITMEDLEAGCEPAISTSDRDKQQERPR